MKIIALFNLKPGASRTDYEAWAKSRDLPDVRSLPSVKSFEVLRATGVLFSEAKPPHDYIEVLDVAALDAFLGDCGSDTVAKLAQEMSAFTDGATFITTEALG
jgi:hypothetical protein